MTGQADQRQAAHPGLTLTGTYKVLKTPAAGNSLLNQELLPRVSVGLQADLAFNLPSLGISGTTSTSPAPWPATLPEQVRAVAMPAATGCGWAITGVV